MYVYAFCTVFQCEFNRNSDYVIQRLYVAQYMIWASSGIVFHFASSCNNDYVIQRLYVAQYMIWASSLQMQNEKQCLMMPISYIVPHIVIPLHNHCYG